MRRHLSLMAAALVLLHTGSTGVEAQEVAGTFDQLRVLVRPGDRITLTDGSGRELRGTIAELSSSSLSLLVGGQRQDLQAGDIQTIRQRRSDSLTNGARWGFGIGAGLGLLGGVAVASEDNDVSAGLVALATLFYAGLGAAIGVGIDAMISSDQVIYARRSAPPPTAFERIVTPQRKSIGVSIRF